MSDKHKRFVAAAKALYQEAREHVVTAKTKKIIAEAEARKDPVDSGLARKQAEAQITTEDVPIAQITTTYQGNTYLQVISKVGMVTIKLDKPVESASTPEDLGSPIDCEWSDSLVKGRIAAKRTTQYTDKRSQELSLLSAAEAEHVNALLCVDEAAGGPISLLAHPGNSIVVTDGSKRVVWAYRTSANHSECRDMSAEFFVNTQEAGPQYSIIPAWYRGVAYAGLRRDTSGAFKDANISIGTLMGMMVIRLVDKDAGIVISLIATKFTAETQVDYKDPITGSLVKLQCRANGTYSKIGTPSSPAKPQIIDVSAIQTKKPSTSTTEPPEVPKPVTPENIVTSAEPAADAKDVPTPAEAATPTTASQATEVVPEEPSMEDQMTSMQQQVQELLSQGRTLDAGLKRLRKKYRTESKSVRDSSKLQEENAKLKAERDRYKSEAAKYSAEAKKLRDIIASSFKAISEV